MRYDTCRRKAWQQTPSKALRQRTRLSGQSLRRGTRGDAYVAQQNGANVLENVCNEVTARSIGAETQVTGAQSGVTPGTEFPAGNALADRTSATSTRRAGPGGAGPIICATWGSWPEAARCPAPSRSRKPHQRDSSTDFAAASIARNRRWVGAPDTCTTGSPAASSTSTNA